MKTMNISLTAEQAKFIDKTTKNYGFANRSEFIRALLRFAFKTDPELISRVSETSPAAETPKIMTLEEIKKRAIPILQKHDVEFAGIFGSYAKGEEKSNSDIDLLYRYKSPQSLLRTVSIKQELEKMLGHKVDLVSEEYIKPLIRPEIIKDLKTLYGQRRYV